MANYVRMYTWIFFRLAKSPTQLLTFQERNLNLIEAIQYESEYQQYVAAYIHNKWLQPFK